MIKDFNLKFRLDELNLLDFNFWTVSIRPQQCTIGSLIIALKRECAELSMLSSDESKELAKVFNSTECLLKKAFSFDKINYLCLMMVDRQVHFHVIPRYKRKLIFMGKLYKDIAWPAPINLLNFIEEPDLELEVYKHLKTFKSESQQIIGYTTGVFDLFHIGHLNILRNAKEQCDYLIVGVTTDELSMQRKKKTPVIELRERMEILSSIEFVDMVVPQFEMDKFAAWKKYKFHKMFVGSDWKGTDKWNELEKTFKEVGTEIVYFPYTNSTSSTLVRELILKINNE